MRGALAGDKTEAILEHVAAVAEWAASAARLDAPLEGAVLTAYREELANAAKACWVQESDQVGNPKGGCKGGC